MAVSLQYWVNYTEGNVKMRRKSEAAVACGRVLSFVYDDECNVVCAHVQASMKDKSYKVMVYLTDSYGISNSTCTLQESSCHHVAAALLYGYRHVAKTDIKCSWIRRPKSAPPKVTQTMEDLYLSTKPNFKALDRPVNQADKDFLFQELSQLGRYTAMHWVLAPEPAREALLVSSVDEILQSPGYLEAAVPRDWLKEKLKISSVDIVKIAELTVGQRTNPLWAMVRKLRLTASNFGIILEAFNKRRITASCQKRLLSAYNLEKVAPIIWGITHEKKALAVYRTLGGEVCDTGIWLHSSGVLGASPDGLVTKSPGILPHFQTPEAQLHSPDLVEIKCPYSARDITVEGAIRGIKGFFLVETSEGLRLRKDHSYYHQIQGQLYITEKFCADLVVWTPSDTQIIRIVKDADWEKNIDNMINFYFSLFLDILG